MIALVANATAFIKKMPKAVMPAFFVILLNSDLYSLSSKSLLVLKYSSKVGNHREWVKKKNVGSRKSEVGYVQ